jgi:hypothetical protein
MIRALHFLILLMLIISFAPLVYGQSSDTTAASGSETGDFVDLTGQAVRITIEPEKPRVNIIADRIKPEFDMMDLDRSYINDLAGGGERIILADPKSQFKEEEIDIEKILNRSR